MPANLEEKVLPDGSRILIRRGWQVATPDEIQQAGEDAWRARMDAVGYVEKRPPGFENRGPLRPGEKPPRRARE